jgi:hypothetical protein
MYVSVRRGLQIGGSSSRTSADAGDSVTNVSLFGAWASQPTARLWGNDYRWPLT